MTQPLHCISTPISWFKLDRRITGELAPSEDARIEEHLLQCHACRASWEDVQATTRLLRPLVMPSDSSESFSQRLKHWWPAALVPALAALVLFVWMGRHEQADVATRPGMGGLTKGGKPVLSLLREHQGDVATDPGVYASGDRFRMLVSCESPITSPWDVVVYQDGAAFFPFAAGNTMECGNATAIPGAFRITGSSPVTICLVFGEPLPKRSSLSSGLPSDLEENIVCQQIVAAEP